MESPLRLTAHGGFGEGDGETRLSKGRKVRPVPTLRSGGGGREAPADHNGLESASQRPLHNLEIVILYRQHVWLQSVVH
jgi:hypothetical protein